MATEIVPLVVKCAVKDTTQILNGFTIAPNPNSIVESENIFQDKVMLSTCSSETHEIFNIHVNE